MNISAGSTAPALRSRQVPSPRKPNSAIVQMVAAGTISGKIAKDVADLVWNEGGDP